MTSISKKLKNLLDKSNFPLNDIQYVLYHRKCPDGFSAAFIVWLYYHINPSLKSVGDKIKYLAYQPNNYKFPSKLANKNVLMVDINYPKQIIDKLRTKVKNLLIIDHHKTYFQEHQGQFYMIQDMNYAASYLTWKVFFPSQIEPKFIKYIQDHDLFIHRFNNSIPFNLTLMMKYKLNSSKDFPSWKKMLQNKEIEKMVENGKKYQEYQQHLLDKNSIRIHKQKWGQYNIGVVNFEVIGLTSEFGNYLCDINPNLDFTVLWSYHYNDKNNRVSLRSRKSNIDLSIIANKFGGGGHQGAASFTWKGNMKELFRLSPH